MSAKPAAAQQLARKLDDRSATVGVIGLGYVGLPLALQFEASGLRVLGFDIDATKIERLRAGQSYINYLPAATIAAAVGRRLQVTSDFDRLGEPDALIVCVPTPLNRHREPDLGYVTRTADQIARHLRAGQLVSLESTTYPGTTDEELRPRLERTGLTVGEDVFLVFSPERQDPGNTRYGPHNIPKIVGGCTPACLELGQRLYGLAVSQVVPVSSPKVAELAKLLENIHRAVNIGLVNEMKIVADRMGIDIFEVIDAAATKPFGFVPYYPGPGLGGHCIPIDPFYLTWKAREYGVHTRFIELAGEINRGMPLWVLHKLAEALNNVGKAIRGARVLIIGIAYKKDVDDLRESPALELLDLLEERGAHVDYHDPHIPHIPPIRRGRYDHRSIPLTAQAVGASDLVLIATNHSAVDYDLIARHAALIIDTRGQYRGGHPNVVHA
ncbi:nucleotide sugar dehydrogenase [Sinimarinibacterium thermocellulolyticum]|uniref:Nucleotide sugar dehydrogenase n=1 Tax=Sinimarinibacterium thermocellulolyticum TaxID=3170016 RepID=A0ABV2A935_9GAMM